VEGFEALEALAARPGDAGVFTDFDGTLAPIVGDPAAARPLDGAAEVLAALTHRYRRVGVISGRPVAFLRDTVGAPGLLLWGEYGLQRMVGDQVVADAEAMRWRGVVEQAAARAEQAGVAERVERKDFSFTLHFRLDPPRQAAVEVWAAEETTRSGLEWHAARSAIELRPPVSADKGTALAEAAAGLDAACFLGDDRGDLAAFDALDRLATEGAQTVRIAVRSPEMEPELERRADIVVEGPAGALDLLRTLL
jgi:trehalose 6-phosphate phosphatase